MPELSVTNVDFSYDDEPFLFHLTFELDKGDRLGLVGKNGAGKTTILRLIGNELEPDVGKIVIARGRKVGILRQIPDYPKEFTGRDVLLSAFEELDALEAELAELSEKLAAGESSRELLSRYGELQMSYEGMGGYDRELETKRVAAGLGIPKALLDGKFDQLSGGERTRLHLARMILRRCDLLLLDEPTNHLDVDSLEWLEEYLAAFPGTLLAVSHDRYFLDKVTNKTLELKDGTVKLYPGNFSTYETLKQAENELLERQAAVAEKERARLTETAERLHTWSQSGGRKMMAQKAAVALRRAESIAEIARPKKERAIKSTFREAGRTGNDLLTVKSLSFSYGGRKILDGVSFALQKDERVGLVGANGAGKTTLLKLLLRELPPADGRILWGTNVKLGYLSQHPPEYPRGLTLTEIAMEELSITSGEARSLLAGALFSGEDAFKFPSDLSGGETSRFRLAMLMRKSVNVLILDEPTNHLDIASREWVERALETYSCALIFVSHDRYFIRKFAERIIELDSGRIENYPYGYEDYAEKRAARLASMRALQEEAWTPGSVKGANAGAGTKSAPQAGVFGGAGQGLPGVGQNPSGADGMSGLSSRDGGQNGASLSGGNAPLPGISGGAGQNLPTSPAKQDREEKLAPSVRRRRLEARVSSLEREISRLEEACRTLDQNIEASSSDHEALLSLLSEREANQTALDAAIEEWEKLSTSLEEPI